MSASRKVDFADTLTVRDTCVCLHTQRAARALARRFDDAFQPIGLTHGQFSLLMSLNRPEPPTIGAVAALLAMDRTTLTAALKVMERRGLVEVAEDPKDRRTRRLRLTGAGTDVLARALPIWREAHHTLEASLGDGEPSRLRAALRRIV